ncbi:MAG: amidohydrolase [Firmicutes bacterium]|nr:amidohydrolase [Bacillota bacterium]
MKNKQNDARAFITNWNKENAQVYYDVADQLWTNPELPMQEYSSSAALVKVLDEAGFDVDTGVAGMPTAFIASYGSGRPVIGINAEYDALPGLSQSLESLDKEPIVQGGPGHGCGHNLLGTAGVKAAIAVKNAMCEFDLSGTIRVIGAPAEELCLGKPYLGKAGYLDGYDAILDWHPDFANYINYDTCQSFFSAKFHFTGRTAHGNAPWNGRSALDAAMLQAHAVEMLREHIYPGNAPNATNTINYTFTTCGPEIANVVPDYTTAWYTGRFATTEEMLDGLERITKCARAGALATDTEVEREIITMTHHKIPNKVLAERLRANAFEFGLPRFTEEEQEKAKTIQRNLGVEEVGMHTDILPFEGGWSGLCDTSEYSWNAPYATAWIAMAPYNCGWHNWAVTRCSGDSMGKKALDAAAGAISLTALDILCEPDLIKGAKEEWEERMDGKSYESLLEENMTPPVELNQDTMEKYRQ